MFIQYGRRMIAAAIILTGTDAMAGEKTHFHIEPILAEGNIAYVSGLNNRGEIAGVVLEPTQGVGFVQQAGQVQTIPHPCQENEQYCVPIPTAINQAGLVAGYYSTTGGETYGFTWKPGDASLTSTFLINDEGCAPCASTTLVLNNAGVVAFSTPGATGLAAGTYYGLPQSLQLLPGSGTSLIVNAIDSRGTLAGISSATAIERVFKFDSHSGAIYTFHPKAAVTISAVALNRFGTVAGSFLDSKTTPHAFVRKDGVTTEFDMPVAATSITVNAINATGRVVGIFNEPGMGPQGFLYNGSIASVIEPPQGIFSSVMDINDRGTIILSSFENFQLVSSYRITCHGIGC
jgi:uncharacterized membrane protein